MRRSWFVILLLAIVTAAVYARVGGHEFVLYDDPDYILDNPHVRAGLTWESVQWAFGNLHGTITYWHPLTWLSHMLDVQLFGLNPGPHHLVNVLFHIINAALVFLVVQRMTGAFWRSAAVAALFALHPLQVDTVAWVTERKNVLSGMFWLLTLGAYARYAERPGAGRYLLMLLFFVLGLLCKPVLVTLPCVLLLLDFWPLRRFTFATASRPMEGSGPLPSSSFARASTGRLLLEKLPLFVCVLASSWITIRAHAGLGITPEATGLPVSLRVENAVVSYARYLGKTFWPQNLAVLYPHPGEWPGNLVLVSALLLAAVTAWAVWEWRRAPWRFVGWFWFVGVLVPMIGLLQPGVHAMADRFAYLPLIGLFVMLVWTANDVAARWPRPSRLLGLMGAAALAGCLVVTSLQLRHWRNSLALFEHAVTVTKGNFVMHGNLAYALNAAGRTEEALAHLTDALRIRPDFVSARLQMAFILQGQKKTTEAIEHYQMAARLKPADPFIQSRLGAALAAVGRYDEAIGQFSTLLRYAPNDADARTQLAAVLAARQRPDEAIEQYRQTLRLRPDAPELLNNLAWILATTPRAEFRNGPEAVTLAERACALTQRKQPMFLGTLAAAYAEAGRFDEAVQTGQQAHDLAVAAGATELAATNQRLLELYRARKPFREEAK